MLLESLHDHACKTYLLADEEEGFAALVDPVLEYFNEYLELVRKRNLTLTHVIDTHTHADHISAGAALKDAARCAYAMHEKALSACVNEPLRDGDVIRVGKLKIQVMHTPGHTEDSLCLKAGHALFTGDALFLDDAGAGRDDLPGGSAGKHWDSLQKLVTLSDNLVVYPAHEYRNRVPSTLGQQRRTNPHLQPRDRDDFIRYSDALGKEPTEWIPTLSRTNQFCAMDPRLAWIPADHPACVIGIASDLNVNTLPVAGIEPVSFRRMLNLHRNIRHARGKESGKECGKNPWLLLDVREPLELDGTEGRIDGVRNIPIGQLSRRISELQPYVKQSIIVICRSGSRAATAARILMASGFECVKVLNGGMHAWNRLPEAADAL